jgi:hypothetical protein
MGGTAAGDDVAFSVGIQVGDDHVFAGHAVVIDETLPPFFALAVELGKKLDPNRTRLFGIAAPADNDFGRTFVAKQVVDREGMTVNELVGQNDPVPAFGVNNQLVSVHRFNRAQRRLRTGTPGADLAGGERRIAACRFTTVPMSIRGSGEGKDAFLPGDYQGPSEESCHEVVRHVHSGIDGFGFPLPARIRWLEINNHFHGLTFAILVSSTMQRHDDEPPGLVRDLDPLHAVRGWLDSREFEGFPALRAIGRRNEIEYGAALLRVPGVPFGADSNFAFAVAVDVLGCDADVVFLGQVFGEDVFLPSRWIIRLGCAWVAVPSELFFVGEENVRGFITIDIGDGDAVTDLHFVVDGNRLEFRLGKIGRSDRGGGRSEEKQSGGHTNPRKPASGPERDDNLRPEFNCRLAWEAVLDVESRTGLAGVPSMCSLALVRESCHVKRPHDPRPR